MCISVKFYLRLVHRSILTSIESSLFVTLKQLIAAVFKLHFSRPSGYKILFLLLFNETLLFSLKFSYSFHMLLVRTLSKAQVVRLLSLKINILIEQLFFLFKPCNSRLHCFHFLFLLFSLHHSSPHVLSVFISLPLIQE